MLHVVPSAASLWVFSMIKLCSGQ